MDLFFHLCFTIAVKREVWTRNEMPKRYPTYKLADIELPYLFRQHMTEEAIFLEGSAMRFILFQ